MKKQLLNHGKKAFLLFVFSFTTISALFAQTLQWAKSSGEATANQTGYIVKTNSNGDVYNFGTFTGTVDFDPGAGTTNLSSGTGPATYIAKFNSGGTLVWARHIYNTNASNGSANVSIKGVTLTGTGDLLLTGSFGGAVDFDPTAGTSILTSTDANDIFICKITAAGGFGWAKMLGVASSVEFGNDISTDASGNVYVCGAFTESMDFGNGSLTPSSTAIQGIVSSGFILKLNSSGTYVSHTRCIESGYATYLKGIELNAAGEIYVTSYKNYRPTYPGGPGNASNQSEIIVYKYSAALARITAVTFDSNPNSWLGSSVVTDLALTSAEEPIVSGYFTYDLHFGSITSNAPYFYAVTTNYSDGFVVKLNATLGVVWAKRLSGTGEDIPKAISLDGSDNIYVTGDHTGTIDFDPSAATANVASMGGKDIFIVKLLSSGDFSGNAQNIGGTSDDLGYDVSVAAGAAPPYHITGSIASANVDFNTNSGVSNLSSSGLQDIFLAKYSDCSVPLPAVNATTVANMNVCSSGATTTLSANSVSGVTFNWYAVAAGGSSVGTGISFVTPPITASTSYWVETSNGCGSSTRTVINVTLSAPSTPSISISAPITTQCSGVALHFTATPSNAGANPGYQWKINGVNTPGATGPTYADNGFTNGQVVTCQLTSAAACATPSVCISNQITLTINTSVTPQITISRSQNPICQGANVSFNSVVTNGGSTPAYQWIVNGVNVGTNSPTYSSTTLANNSQVKCYMSSNALCAIPANDLSNVFTMTVSNPVTPALTIAASQTSICTGATVTLTATPTNGGGSPGYQWKKNSVNIGGATSSTYSSNSFVNGDVISCVLTSSACSSPATATSNSITITVASSVVPAVNIAASQNTICLGANITFTATPTNGGAAPTYQWKVNGGNVATGPTYASSSLTNGQVVTCVLTSNSTCASPLTATSNSVTITIAGSVVPAITISGNNTICSGSSITFNSSVLNGGSAPTYQWKVNGVNVGGATAATYTATGMTNGSVVTCALVSNNGCASPATANSNSITVTVGSTVVPSITVSAGQTTICSGTNVTVNSSVVNGGSSPVYDWYLNGQSVGSSASFTSPLLLQGDQVSCQLISNAACAAPATASSNTVTFTVNSSLVPVISISQTNPSLCDNDTAHFVSQITNGGTSPVYQWKVNNISVSTAANFDTLGLTNGDLIKCILTSNETCVSTAVDTSQVITASVLISNATISINATAPLICQGDMVTLLSSVSGSGANPNYQWYLNNNPILGATSPSYVSHYFNNSDVVYCLLSTLSQCGTNDLDSSNTMVLTVGAPGGITTIYINTPQHSVCSTDSVIFTSNYYNGGNNPAFAWRVNGIAVGTNSYTFSSTSLNNGDQVACAITSSDGCLATNTYTSTAITMTVTPTVIPDINITTSDSLICPGQNVTFNNSYTNGGSAPQLVWYLLHTGYSMVGSGSSYSSSTLINNDTIVTVLVNGDYCAIPNFSTAQISMTVGIDTSVTHSGATFTANLSGATYQWIDCNNGNQAIPGETNQSFTPTVSGNYAVVINIGGCSDTSTCVLGTPVGTSAAFAGENSGIKIYPNPSNGVFTIQSENEGVYSITNELGQIVKVIDLNSVNKYTATLENFGSGVYAVSGVSNSKMVVQKIVITK